MKITRTSNFTISRLTFICNLRIFMQHPDKSGIPAMLKVFLFALLITSVLLPATPAESWSQGREEPELGPPPEPRSPYDEDLHNSIGFKILLNNYGFGLGSEYRRLLSTTSEFLINFNISNLKDESEQTFRDFWGQQIIPNKYNRVLLIPVTAGLKQRLFPQSLSDNFRVFVTGSAGVTPAFVYPYFDQGHGLGFRPEGQRPYDVFGGWSEGYFTTGFAGEMSIGVDFGSDFSQLQSARFGYKFYFFPDELQILEPNSPFPNQDGFDAQRFFQSPQVTIVIGSNW